MPEDLFRALQNILPPGAGAGWADPRAEYAPFPNEPPPYAIAARQREFIAGRHAARMAMHAIGLPVAAIQRGTDRAPIWPKGMIGAITHTKTACLAVVMRQGTLRGIGVDLEPAIPLDSDLWDSILLPAERRTILRLPLADRGLAALRIFCAKESVFKTHYPLTRALTGFEVVEVIQSRDTFTATFQTDLLPLQKGDGVQGRILQAHGHILALAML